MNFLQVFTKEETSNSFIVHWTNTTEGSRGSLRITVPSTMEDANIIAELYALQHLLEVKEVIGNNIAGNENIKLIVSLGAIKKLSRKASDKREISEYAKFLTTRFRGCVLEVDKNEKWLGTQEPTETLDASKPMSEHIEIHGFGDVILTAHIVEQYADRFGKKLIGDAWRYLKKVAAEEKIIEIDKNNKATRMKYALKGREVGRYFYHTTKDVMLVVAKNAEGYPSLVTAYKIDYKL